MDSVSTQPETSAEQKKFALSNYWEARVMERAKVIVSQMDMCQCEKCFFDVCALVLNKLPPQYTTTDKGNLMIKVPATSAKAELELTILISRSAKMVRDRPMH